MILDRRRFLTRILPGLPFLPQVIDKVANKPRVVDLMWNGSAERLANGTVYRTRQAIQVWSNGARKVVEDVSWITRGKETLPGSTVWKKAIKMEPW